MSEYHREICAHTKPGPWLTSRRIPCLKPGEFEEGGNWYCETHAPSRRKGRRAASARASRIAAAKEAVVEAAKEWARDWHQNLDTEALEERLAARCAELEEAEHAE